MTSAKGWLARLWVVGAACLFAATADAQWDEVPEEIDLFADQPSLLEVSARAQCNAARSEKRDTLRATFLEEYPAYRAEVMQSLDAGDVASLLRAFEELVRVEMEGNEGISRREALTALCGDKDRDLEACARDYALIEPRFSMGEFDTRWGSFTLSAWVGGPCESEVLQEADGYTSSRVQIGINALALFTHMGDERGAPFALYGTEFRNDFWVFRPIQTPPAPPPPAPAPPPLPRFHSAMLDLTDQLALATREGTDRRQFILKEDLLYCRETTGEVFLIPAGFITDLLSVAGIGRILRSDRTYAGAVIHDWLFALGGEEPDRQRAEAMFNEELRFGNVGFLRRFFITTGTDDVGPLYVKVVGRDAPFGRVNEMRFATPESCERGFAMREGDEPAVVGILNAHLPATERCDDFQRNYDRHFAQFASSRRVNDRDIVRDADAAAYLKAVTDNQDPEKSCRDFAPTAADGSEGAAQAE